MSPQKPGKYKELETCRFWGALVQTKHPSHIHPTAHHVDSGLVLRYVSLALHMNPWVGLQIPWVDDFATRLTGKPFPGTHAMRRFVYLPI